jgi:hypothetical protein
MEHLIKKLARYSLKHPRAGGWILVPILIGIAIYADLCHPPCRIFPGLSPAQAELYGDVLLGSIAVISVFSLMFGSIIDSRTHTLPETVFPKADRLLEDYPHQADMVNRLKTLALQRDDASLLNRWISAFRKKMDAEAQMALLEEKIP